MSNDNDLEGDRGPLWLGLQTVAEQDRRLVGFFDNQLNAWKGDRASMERQLAASTADRERLKKELATTTSERERLQKALNRVERELDTKARELKSAVAANDTANVQLQASKTLINGLTANLDLIRRQKAELEAAMRTTADELAQQRTLVQTLQASQQLEVKSGSVKDELLATKARIERLEVDNAALNLQLSAVKAREGEMATRVVAATNANEKLETSLQATNAQLQERTRLFTELDAKLQLLKRKWEDAELKAKFIESQWLQKNVELQASFERQLDQKLLAEKKLYDQKIEAEKKGWLDAVKADKEATVATSQRIRQSEAQLQESLGLCRKEVDSYGTMILKYEGNLASLRAENASLKKGTGLGGCSAELLFVWIASLQSMYAAVVSLTRAIDQVQRQILIHDTYEQHYLAFQEALKLVSQVVQTTPKANEPKQYEMGSLKLGRKSAAERLAESGDFAKWAETCMDKASQEEARSLLLTSYSDIPRKEAKAQGDLKVSKDTLNQAIVAAQSRTGSLEQLTLTKIMSQTTIPKPCLKEQTSVQITSLWNKWDAWKTDVVKFSRALLDQFQLIASSPLTTEGVSKRAQKLIPRQEFQQYRDALEKTLTQLSAQLNPPINMQPPTDLFSNRAPTNYTPPPSKSGGTFNVRFIK